MKQSLSDLSPEGLLAAVKDAYAKAFTLKGRVGRRGFLYYTTFAYAIWIALWAIAPGPKLVVSNSMFLFDPFALFSPFGQIRAVILLLVSVPMVSLYARRLHDLGISAGWAFVLMLVVMIIPLSGLAADAALCLARGMSEANEYGPGDRPRPRPIRLDDSGRRGR